jgi:hypothetical protein
VKHSMKTIILSAGVLLAACGQDKSAAEPQQKAIPMDGKVHVLEQRGRFVITSTTLFCVKEPDYQSYISKLDNNLPMIDHILMDILSKHLGNNGQYIDANGDRHGRIYFGELRDKYCPDNGHNIILHQSLTVNASGKPYRIEMSARQGAVVVSLGIERAEGHERPGVDFDFPPYRVGFIQRAKVAIVPDSKDVSSAIISYIFNGSSK